MRLLSCLSLVALVPIFSSVLAACASESSVSEPLDEESALAAAGTPYGFYSAPKTLPVAPGAYQRLAIVKDFDTGTCRFEARRCERATPCTFDTSLSIEGACTLGSNQVQLEPEGTGVAPATLSLALSGTTLTVSQGAKVVGTLERERNAMTPAVLTRLGASGTSELSDAFDRSETQGYYAREYLAAPASGDRRTPILQSAASKSLNAALEAALRAGLDTAIDLEADDMSRATVGEARHFVTILSNATGAPIAAHHWWIQDGCDRGDRSRRNRYATEPEATGDDCDSDDVQWQLYAYFSVTGTTVKLLGGDPYEWSGY